MSNARPLENWIKSLGSIRYNLACLISHRISDRSNCWSNPVSMLVQKTLTLEDFTFMTKMHYQAPSDDEWGEHEIDHILFVKKVSNLHFDFFFISFALICCLGLIFIFGLCPFDDYNCHHHHFVVVIVVVIFGCSSRFSFSKISFVPCVVASKV